MSLVALWVRNNKSLALRGLFNRARLKLLNQNNPNPDNICQCNLVWTKVGRSWIIWLPQSTWIETVEQKTYSVTLIAKGQTRKIKSLKDTGSESRWSKCNFEKNSSRVLSVLSAPAVPFHEYAAGWRTGWNSRTTPTPHVTADGRGSDSSQEERAISAGNCTPQHTKIRSHTVPVWMRLLLIG